MLERGPLTAEQQAIAAGEAAHCTFKPSIGNADAVLIHTRPERIGETEAERIERLACGDQKRIQHVRQSIQNQYVCPAAPCVVGGSRQPFANCFASAECSNRDRRVPSLFLLQFAHGGVQVLRPVHVQA